LLVSGNRGRAILSVSYRNVSAAPSHLNKVVCAGVETFAGQTGKIRPGSALQISGSCYGGTTVSYILLSIAQLRVLSPKRWYLFEVLKIKSELTVQYVHKWFLTIFDSFFSKTYLQMYFSVASIYEITFQF
jgi:hypothetical protein